MHFQGIAFQVAEGASGSIGGYIKNEDLSAMVLLADEVEDTDQIHFCNCGTFWSRSRPSNEEAGEA